MFTKPKDVSDRILATGESSSIRLQYIGKKKVVVKHSVRSNPKKEMKALKLAKKAHVPVPAVIKFEKGEMYIEFLNARTIQKADLTDKFFEDLTSILKKLHSIKVSKVGDIVSPTSFSQKNWLYFLKTKLKKSLDYLVQNKKIDDTQAKELLAGWIKKVQKLPKRDVQPTLVHGDVHLYNILINFQKKLFLIDFEDAFYGDPLYDFVTFSNFHPKIFPKFKKFYTNKSPLSPGSEDWFDVYQFVHLVWLCFFYVDIGKDKVFHKYFTKILTF